MSLLLFRHMHIFSRCYLQITPGIVSHGFKKCLMKCIHCQPEQMSTNSNMCWWIFHELMWNICRKLYLEETNVPKQNLKVKDMKSNHIAEAWTGNLAIKHLLKALVCQSIFAIIFNLPIKKKMRLGSTIKNYQAHDQGSMWLFCNWD